MGEMAWSAGKKCVTSLKEVMSEQLAEDMVEGEIKTEFEILYETETEDQVNDTVVMADASECKLESNLSSTIEDDFLLAQMLQHEYNKEHDEQLRMYENQYNGPSKVSMSFENYRAVHPLNAHSADSSDEDSSPDEDDFDVKDKVLHFKKCGYLGKGSNIVTKHDAEHCARANATKAMQKFPPGVHTGDDSVIDRQLPNHIYNQLKLHSMTEQKRSHRFHEKKDHSTHLMAVDSRTRTLLGKLINNGLLQEITGLFSTGKESVVLHAFGGSFSDMAEAGNAAEAADDVPKECAVKVFKTTLNEFKNRDDYIRGDFRLAKDKFRKNNPRKIIKLWALKEMMNLNRMRQFGLRCPDVVALKKHILVMSFIGDNQQAAPKLVHAKLTPIQLSSAYNQTVKMMKDMYESCGLVHADLSEYNILWHENKVWFIDVSQAVDICHPSAYNFLLRDCKHIVQFFTKRKVEKVLTVQDLFIEVTSRYELCPQASDEEFLQQIVQFEKERDFGAATSSSPAAAPTTALG